MPRITTSRNLNEPEKQRTKCWTEAPVGPFRALETVLAGAQSTLSFVVIPWNLTFGKLLTTTTVFDGRRGAFTTGYRPQFRYRGQDNDVSITIPEDIWIEPGDSTDAWLSFYRPDLQQSRLQLGSSFTLAEGGKNIAVGTITEILDQSMNNPTPMRESVIFVDVDDTLIRSFGTKQIPIPTTIQYVRDQFNAGHLLYCWSRGGAQYARDVATQLGILDCFVCFLPKPDVVVDDRLERLLDHCQFVHPNNAVTKPEATDNPMDRSGGSAAS